MAEASRMVRSLLDSPPGRRPAAGADVVLPEPVDHLWPAWPEDLRELNTGEGDAVLRGDVPAGVSITGSGTLRIEGSILGTRHQPTRVSIAGQITVTGDVSWGFLTAVSVVIGGDAESGRIVARKGVRVGGIGSDCTVRIGATDELQRQVDALNAERARAQARHQTAQSEVRRAARDLRRMATSVTVPVSLQVPPFVHHSKDHLEIDLSPVYRALAIEPEELTKRALNQFFTKGIAGVLGRTYRVHLERRPFQERAFTTILSTLRNLFHLTRERDLQGHTITSLAGDLAACLQLMRSTEPILQMTGAPAVGAQVTMEQADPAASGSSMARINVHSCSMTVLELNDDVVYAEMRYDDGSVGGSEMQLASHCTEFARQRGRIVARQLTGDEEPQGVC